MCATKSQQKDQKHLVNVENVLSFLPVVLHILDYLREGGAKWKK